MHPIPAKADILRQLQKEIRALEGGGRAVANTEQNTGLGFIGKSFPDGSFPLAAVHELISADPERAAATNGFIAGMLCYLMQGDGLCLWIGTKRTIFPPALKFFNIEPERIVFIDTVRERETLWTIEEALKCKSVSAVVGELREVSFTESRRLQLAVEQSGVTGFIHRHNPKTENTTAFASRWKVSPIASETGDRSVPGVGIPRWHVALTIARNGKPAEWQIEWAGGFRMVPRFVRSISHPGLLKTG